MDLTVTIANWNAKELLSRCLLSVPGSVAGLGYEAIVVDNGSQDGSPEMVEEEFPGVRLIRSDRNLGFSGAQNRAIKAAKGRYICILNSDTRLFPRSLRSLVGYLECNRGVGIVGPQLQNEDLTLQRSVGLRYPNIFNLIVEFTGASSFLPGSYKERESGHHGPRLVKHVNGACMLVRREVFDDVGSFDEGFFLYLEEMDFCYRAYRKGWTIAYFPEAKVVHREGGSLHHQDPASLKQRRESFLRYLEKNRGGVEARLLRGFFGLRDLLRGELR